MSLKYRIVVDGVDIYDKEPAMQIISPKLEVSLGSAGSFEFTLPPEHVFYDLPRLMLSTVLVYEDASLIWTGRITSEEIDFYKQRTFKCEGALAFLNDSVFRFGSGEKTLTTMFQNILNAHNSQVANNRKIYAGTVTVTPGADNYTPMFEWDSMSCFDAIQELLVGRFGGYLFWDNVNGYIHLHWVKKVDDIFGNMLIPEIRYGMNLKDAIQSTDVSDFVTQVIPYGKEVATPITEIVDPDDWDEYAEEHAEDEYTEEVKTNKKGIVTRIIMTRWEDDAYPRPDDYDYSGDPCTIRAVNNGNDMIVSPDAVTLYGPITKVLTYSDISDRHVLYAKGLNYLLEQQWDRLTIECSAADFNTADDAPFPVLYLGQVVHVTSSPHLIDKNFPISKISYDLTNGTKDVTLGTLPHQTLTEFTASEKEKNKREKYKGSKTKSDKDTKRQVDTNVGSLDKAFDKINSLGGEDGWSHVLCTLAEYKRGSQNGNTIYMIYG